MSDTYVRTPRKVTLYGRVVLAATHGKGGKNTMEIHAGGSCGYPAYKVSWRAPTGEFESRSVSLGRAARALSKWLK